MGARRVRQHGTCSAVVDSDGKGGFGEAECRGVVVSVLQ